MPFGDGAGFVQNKGVDFMQAFQGGGVFEEDAFFGALAAADHNCYRRCQAKCTWAADDDDRDAHFNGKGKRFTDDEPDAECHEGDGQDGWYKDSGHAVGRAGDWRLGGVGVFHQVDDLRQCCVCTNGRGSEAETAGGVDGAGGNGVADVFFNRQAFTGKGAFIDR